MYKALTGIALALTLSACQTTGVHSQNALTQPFENTDEYGYARAKASNKINYSREIEFKTPAGEFLLAEQPVYSKLWQKRYNKTSRGRILLQHSRHSESECESALRVYDLNMQANVNTSDAEHITSDSERECWNAVIWQLHMDWASGVKNSRAMTFFFETITPMVISGAWMKENDQYGGTTEKMMENYFAAYSIYSDYYGTSDELDTEVLKNYVYRERYVTNPLTKRKFLNCPKDSWNAYPNVGHYVEDSCNNYAAERALTKVLVGLKFQHKDILNEGIAILEHIAASSHGEGATLDAYRGSDAVGYLMQLSTNLAPAAYIVSQHTNVNAYELGGGKFNNTVYDVLDYSYRAMMDPEMNYKYSSRNVHEHNGMDYKKQNWAQGSSTDVRGKQAMYVQSAGAYAQDKPYLKDLYRQGRKNSKYDLAQPSTFYWNGALMVQTTGFKIQ